MFCLRDTPAPGRDVPPCCSGVTRDGGVAVTAQQQSGAALIQHLLKSIQPPESKPFPYLEFASETWGSDDRLVSSSCLFVCWGLGCVDSGVLFIFYMLVIAMWNFRVPSVQRTLVAHGLQTGSDASVLSRGTDTAAVVRSGSVAGHDPALFPLRHVWVTCL